MSAPGARHKREVVNYFAGRPRILLTLATGKGKTFIAFQISVFRGTWRPEQLHNSTR